MAAQHVGRLLRADHAGQRPPRVARHPDQHRQHRRLAVPDRDVVVGEPQVPLAQLARLVLGAPERLRHLIRRAQLGHPLAQHRDPPRPADPLGDHRRRHVRRHRQQPADRRLERVDRRTRPLPLIPRRHLGPQRRPHRVASHTQLADDGLHAHPLSPVQPSDLCPFLHVDHVPSPGRPYGRARLKSKPLTVVDPSGEGVRFRPVIRGQYSGGGDTTTMQGRPSDPAVPTHTSRRCQRCQPCWCWMKYWMAARRPPDDHGRRASDLAFCGAPPGIRTQNLRIKRGLTTVRRVRSCPLSRLVLRPVVRSCPSSRLLSSRVHWMKYWMLLETSWARRRRHDVADHALRTRVGVDITPGDTGDARSLW